MSTSIGSVAASKSKDLHRMIDSQRSRTNLKQEEKDIDDKLIRDELEARKQASHSVLYLVLMNSYSSLIVFMFYLVSLESLISIGLSVGMTILAYNRTEYDSSFDGKLTLVNFGCHSSRLTHPNFECTLVQQEQ